MIVTLDQLLFQEGMAARLHCLRLVLAADERRHVLLTDPPWESEAADQPVNRWLSRLPPELIDTVQATLEVGLDEAANMGASVARIRVERTSTSRWGDGVLSPDDALRLMQTPLWLVLENGRNDLQFLRRILEKKDRDALDERLADGRVEVPLGGGTGELMVFLENLVTLPGVPSPSPETTSWIRRFRSWVMFDRDAHPDDLCRPSKTSETLLDLCGQMTRPRSFPGHQLGRRTIENYLPFQALDHWAQGGDGAKKKQRRQRVEAFKSSEFGALRRACFAMKDGFMKDVAQTVRDEFKHRERLQRKDNGHWMQGAKLQASRKRKPRRRERWLQENELPAVFQGMASEAPRNLLNRGFGSKIAELYADTEVHDVWFHRVFDDDPVAGAWRKRLVESLWEVL